MVENQGKAKLHRYYVIENGYYVDPFYNLYPPQGPSALRQLLPCYRAAFAELEQWVENKGDKLQPPANTAAPNAETGDEAHQCSINEEATCATYTAPATEGP